MYVWELKWETLKDSAFQCVMLYIENLLDKVAKAKSRITRLLSRRRWGVVSSDGDVLQDFLSLRRERVPQSCWYWAWRFKNRDGCCCHGNTEESSEMWRLQVLWLMRWRPWNELWILLLWSFLLLFMKLMFIFQGSFCLLHKIKKCAPCLCLYFLLPPFFCIWGHAILSLILVRVSSAKTRTGHKSELRWELKEGECLRLALPHAATPSINTSVRLAPLYFCASVEQPRLLNAKISC